MHIDEKEISIFDTETTGLEPASGDRIVEIAALRFKGGQRLGQFQSLINTGKEISPGAFQVNKITPEMLRDAPSPGQVIPVFLDFVKGSTLCSYNAGFDLDFLKHELELLGSRLPQDLPVLDVLKMAKRTLPRMERYALWFVAERLRVERKQEHRAFSDVEMTFEVFQRLKTILGSKEVADCESYSRLFSVNRDILENFQAQRIAEIQEAIDLKVNLKIKYLSTVSAEVSVREVIPREVRRDGAHAYLVGYCCFKKDERSFRVDGILHLEIL
jgi:DNA polymerase III epsilon subunit family exonuclease